MEINEKLLRQIIEDVLSEMQTSDKPVSFRGCGFSVILANTCSRHSVFQ